MHALYLEQTTHEHRNVRVSTPRPVRSKPPSEEKIDACIWLAGQRRADTLTIYLYVGMMQNVNTDVAIRSAAARAGALFSCFA